MDTNLKTLSEKKESSILNQLKSVFFLGIFFLLLSLLFFQNLNQKVLTGIIDAYHLDGGIISTSHLQESIDQLGKTLNTVKRDRKGLDKLYANQFREINSSLSNLIKEFNKFNSPTPYLEEAKSSLEQIHLLAAKIFSNDKLTPNQLTGYLLEAEQHRLEATESLAKAALEFRSLLDKTYHRIQETKHRPLIFGIALTFLLAIVLGLLSSAIFRRVRFFIKNHLNATQEVSKGNLDTKITILQQDEFGQISHAFNKMVLKLKATTAELERSNQDLQDFAYTASHDLQTPLRHISSFSEMVAQKKDSASQKELNEWSENIKTSTENVIRLIDDLLRFSKVGKEELKREKIQTDQLIQKVINQSQKAYSSLSIHRDLLPDIIGYKSLLYLVFQNLIDNAVKYGPDHGTPEVSISAQEHPEWIQFMVADNGEGVPDSQKERIFGLFRRLHSEEDVKGSGAGLAICRKVIERHGGQIWVEDNKDRGSIFCFTIPR